MSGRRDGPWPVDPGLADYCGRLRRRLAPRPRLLLMQMPQFLLENLSLDALKNRSYYAFPPTGLQWLAKTARAMGVETAIFDLNFSLLDKLAHDPDFRLDAWMDLAEAALDRFRPSIVGLGGLTVYVDLFDPPHPLTRLLARLMERGRYVVIAGGPTANNEIERYLAEGYCHFLVEGEGETRLGHLLDLLLHEVPTTPAAGGIHYPRDGVAVRSRGEECAVAVRGNLVDTYAEIPLERYPRVGSLNPYSRMAGLDTVYAPFQLARGCRCNCRFCGVRPFMGKGVRCHDVAEVLAEMRYLAARRGVRHFEALDDDFLAEADRVAALLRGMVGLREEFGITWAANNGMMALSLDRELLALMRDSGCLGFKIGIEAGDPDMLRRVRKPGTVAGFLRVGHMLREFPELFVGGNYIIGLFGEETFGQMLATYRLSRAMRLDWSSFAVFQFTSKPNSRAENLKTDAAAATDFIPAKDSAGRGAPDDPNLAAGLDVFALPPDLVPSRALVKNIWLAFNLTGNYIGNKNLDPDGDPAQFVAWLRAVHLAYPGNPYMALFLGLGLSLLDRPGEADGQYARSRRIVEADANWQRRFATYGLLEPLAAPPRSRREVFAALAKLREPFLPYLGGA